MAKDPKEILRLHGDHMQPSAAKLGPQDGGLVPCKNKPNLHPHYPANEGCELCPHKSVIEKFGKYYYKYFALSVSYARDDWDTLSEALKETWNDMAQDEINVAKYTGKLPVWHPQWRD